MPNTALRHILVADGPPAATDDLPEGKPVTNSRDAQELPFEAGTAMVRVFASPHAGAASTSLLDDMAYYGQREAERDRQRLKSSPGTPPFEE